MDRNRRRDDPAELTPPPIFYGADLTFVRALNRALVLNFVRTRGRTQSNDIAAGTGLSRATVSRVLEILGNEGLVRKGGQLAASARGGRRATEVEFRADAGCVIGVDLGKSHLGLLLTDLLGREQSVSGVGAAEFRAFSGVETGPEACLQTISDLLRAFVLRRGLTWDRVRGIGLAAPGPFNVTTQRLVDPPGMTGWDQVDLRSLFASLLEYPMDQVVVDNDANMGALAESRLGAGRGIDNFLYLKIGTGIGMGLVLHGNVYRGSYGGAGEFGHIEVDRNGKECACGHWGCLETIVGADAVVDAANRQRRSTTEAALSDIAQVVAAAYAGNPACLRAIEQAGEQLGACLAPMANVLNPERIIIDGGLAEAGDLLLAPVRVTVRQHTVRLIWQSLGDASIMRGALRTKAIATGAALSTLDRLFSLPMVEVPAQVRETV